MTEQEKLKQLNSIIEQLIVLDGNTSDEDNVLLLEAIDILDNHRLNTFGHQIDWHTVVLPER